MQLKENDRLQKQISVPSEIAWDLVELSTQDEDTESAAKQDLEFMQQDEKAHLTAAATQYVISYPDAAETTQIVLPHLRRCSWCRNTLHETLTLCGKEQSHRGYTLLTEAEETVGYSQEEWQAMQTLVKAGLMKEIKPRNQGNILPYTPVPIEGMPLSETIVEERR